VILWRESGAWLTGQWLRVLRGCLKAKRKGVNSGDISNWFMREAVWIALHFVKGRTARKQELRNWLEAVNA
jgi:hypothetical protein